MITSVQNTRIKWVRSLQTSSRERRQSDAFVVEGARMAEEALESGSLPQLVLYTEEFEKRAAAVLQKFTSIDTTLEAVSPHVMKSASDTQHPQGILVVLPLVSFLPPDSPDLVLIPDCMRDPGNMGSMMRSAAAAGVDAVFIPPESVDPYAPKVLRAAMGAHFKLPIARMGWDEIARQLESMRVFTASAHEGKSYDQVDMTQPLALIIGGEAAGASIEAGRLTSEYITIPMPGEIESLNAAAAAGILLFEAVRQRKRTK